MWAYLVFLEKSLSKWISQTDLVFLNKQNLNTNPSHFLLTSEPKKCFRVLDSLHFSLIPWKQGQEEISVSLDPGVLDSWDIMKTFRLVLWLWVWRFFFFVKVCIMKWSFHLSAAIFIWCVPFVCSSNFFLKNYVFSKTLMIFVCFSCWMFTSCAYWFWVML